MTTPPVLYPGAPTITAAVWAFIVLLLSALFVAYVSLLFVREQYRETRQHWPHAKLIWVLVGVGAEALAAGLIAVGLAGVLGLDRSPSVIFLDIAEGCGAIGIPVLFIAILIGLFVGMRYGWPHKG